MTKIDLYTETGKKQGSIAVPKVFEAKVKPESITQAYLAEVSKKAVPSSHTKNRGDVSGTGKKPWRQKGTGRARAGSARSPLWRGGGITFGPTSARNFVKRIPKNQRKRAIYGLIAEKIAAKKVIAVTKIEQKNIKTKEIAIKIASLPIEGTALLIIEKIDEKISKSVKNIPYLKVITIHKLNLTDILNKDWIIFTKSSLESVER